jgi:hypothetical protein
MNNRKKAFRIIVFGTLGIVGMSALIIGLGALGVTFGLTAELSAGGFLFVVAIVWTEFQIRVAHKREIRLLRLLEGCCVNCGYDLRATTGRCPECGIQPHRAQIGAKKA